MRKPRQRSAARISAAYISLSTARSPKACGMTLVRRRSSPNNRSSMLVVRIARRCASGKRRWAMHASKSSCRHASADLILRHLALQIAQLVGETALPRRAREAFLDRADQAGRAVGDDQQRIGQAAPSHVLEELAAARRKQAWPPGACWRTAIRCFFTWRQGAMRRLEN